MSTYWQLTFDCADPAALAAFWRLALGYGDGPPPAGELAGTPGERRRASRGT